MDAEEVGMPASEFFRHALFAQSSSVGSAARLTRARHAFVTEGEFCVKTRSDAAKRSSFVVAATIEYACQTSMVVLGGARTPVGLHGVVGIFVCSGQSTSV